MNIKKVTCYGSGVIGSGWAVNFLLNGLDTTVYDLDNEKLDAAKKAIENAFTFLVSENVLSQGQATQALSMLHLTTDTETAVKDADLIQENGPENINIKRSIIADMEKHCKDDAIITSSTSGLLISDIGRDAKHPERIIGGHPYNPVYLVPLVELTKCEKTDEKYLNAACDFYRSVNKEPIILQKEALGFIANRLQVALYREAVDLTTRGVCTVEEVDKAVCYGPGLRYALMGPNTIYQLGGGAHGIGGILQHIGATVPLWWKDMANWTEWPEGFRENVQADMNKAMEMRDAEHGRTNEEIANFRDKGLVMLLKYHNKL